MNKDVDKSLTMLFSTDMPIIMEISELLDDPVIPKLMSRSYEDGTIASPALQDMAPFIDKTEYDELMSISRN